MSRFFRYPVSSHLSPNATGRDIGFALNAIVNPFFWGKWLRGTSVGRLEQFFIDTYNVDYARSFDSGRTALTALLAAVVKPGDLVYIQAFTCIAVPNAVRAAGATPVFVDIDDTLNIDPEDLEKKIVEHGSPAAIIVQHMFGYPGQLRALKAVAEQHDAKLIEDCAHAFGSYTADGDLVGTVGDAAMFSFGRDKPISCVSGGAAITKDPEIGEKLNAYWKELPLPPRKWIWQRFNHPLIFGIAKPLYNVFELGKVIIALSKKLGFFPLVLTRKEKDGSQEVGAQLPNGLAKWVLLQIDQAPKMNRHRMAMAELYSQLLDESGLQFTQPQRPKEDAMTSYLRYSVLLDHDSSDLLMQMRADAILLGDWYKTVIAPKDASYAAAGYVEGSCPRAEQACVGIINLPTNITTSESDARRIVRSLKKYLS